MPNIFKDAQKRNNEKKGNQKPNNRKNGNEKNFFMLKKESDISEEKSFVLKDESFPSLGNVKEKPTLTISFSAALNKEHEKKREKTNKWAGWIIMKKDGTIIQHEESERLKRVRGLVEKMDNNKKYLRLLRHCDQIEMEKRIEEYLNGPDYIESWEISSYLSEREKSDRNNNEYTDSDYDDDYYSD